MSGSRLHYVPEIAEGELLQSVRSTERLQSNNLVVVQHIERRLLAFREQLLERTTRDGVILKQG